MDVLGILRQTHAQHDIAGATGRWTHEIHQLLHPLICYTNSFFLQENHEMIAIFNPLLVYLSLLLLLLLLLSHTLPLYTFYHHPPLLLQENHEMIATFDPSVYHHLTPNTFYYPPLLLQENHEMIATFDPSVYHHLSPNTFYYPPLLSQENHEMIATFEAEAKWRFAPGFAHDKPSARLTIDPVFVTQVIVIVYLSPLLYLLPIYPSSHITSRHDMT